MCAFQLPTSFSVGCLFLLNVGLVVCWSRFLLSAWCCEQCLVPRDYILIPLCLSWSVPHAEPRPSLQLSPPTRSTPLLTSGLYSHCSPYRPCFPSHLSLTKQILPILLYGRSVSSMMVSTGPQSPGFHSLTVSHHHVLFRSCAAPGSGLVLSGFHKRWVFVLMDLGLGELHRSYA